MDISKKLKQLREKNNLTQEELAKKLNISRSTIANYESESRTPDITMLHCIADFFNITLDSLINDNIENMMIKKTKSKSYKYKVLSFISLIFTILIIFISNIIHVEHDYGYDINNDELKVKNSSNISVVEIIEKVPKHEVYKVNIVNSLKGSTFSYISIKNKEIEINMSSYYLVFGNYIQEDPSLKNYVSLDTIEIYDYLFIYELNEFNINYLNNDKASSNSIIDYYSSYIDKEINNVVYSKLLESRKEILLIDSKDRFSNPYSKFNLNEDFDLSYLEMKKLKMKYLDIEIKLKVDKLYKYINNVYLYWNIENNDNYYIDEIKINFNKYNYETYDNILISFRNIPINYFNISDVPELYIRYDCNSTLNSSLEISEVDIRIGYKL